VTGGAFSFQALTRHAGKRRRSGAVHGMARQRLKKVAAGWVLL